MRKYLYKFKSGADRDICSVENKQLWVSTYKCLNDVSDINVYVNDESRDIAEKGEKLLEEIRNATCCISFSKTPYSKRLWDYYTNGMKGMCICYESIGIENALKQQGIAEYIQGDVVYDGIKTDITDCLKGNCSAKDVCKDAFFHKTPGWSEEKEYRYAFEYHPTHPYYFRENGFLLNDVKAHHIFVGADMEKEFLERLKNYCRKENICLYQIKPDITDRDSRKYKRTVLIGKAEEPDSCGKQYEQMLI